jgi:hypothetical protein
MPHRGAIDLIGIAARSGGKAAPSRRVARIDRGQFLSPKEPWPRLKATDVFSGFAAKLSPANVAWTGRDDPAKTTALSKKAMGTKMLVRRSV